MKIVSLLPSATEIVYSLGLQESLEGVSHECDYPAEARAKAVISNTSIPALGDASPGEIDRLVNAKVSAGEPLYTLDRDRIRAIQPDLILAQDLCRVCAVPSGHVIEALDTLGCSASVVSLDPSTLDDILEGIEEVGRAAGCDQRAAALTASLRARINAVERAVKSRPAPTVGAIEWADPPFVGGHWVPEMVRRAGGRDVLGIEGAPSHRTTWAEVAAAAPEVILYMPCGYFLDGAIAQARELYNNPEFASTPAARSGRVFATDASAYFSRPGPRVVDGVEITAWALHPDDVPEPPPGRLVRVEHK